MKALQTSILLLFLFAGVAAAQTSTPRNASGLTLQDIRVSPEGEVAKTVLRLIPLAAGDVVDSNTLVHTRAFLEATGRFSSVVLYTARGDRPGAVILFVEAALDRGFHIETGLGLEDMQGWYLNLIGVRYNNPFHRGGVARVGWRLGTPSCGIYIEAEYPRLISESFDLLLENTFERKDWPVCDGDREMYQIILAHSLHLGLRRWSRAQLDATLWFGLTRTRPGEHLHDDDMEEEIPVSGRLLPLPDGHHSYLDLRLDMSCDRRDLQFPWRQGYWLGLRLEARDKLEGGAFWGLELDSNWALPIRDSQALALRARAAYAGVGTSYYLRPVVGGLRSLRGFKTASLSTSQGARGLWQLNMEYRHAVLGDDLGRPRVTNTAFLDIGDHWSNKGGHFGFSASIGYGLLFRIPWIQILNAEVSYPLTENLTGDSLIASISLGRSF